LERERAFSKVRAVAFAPWSILAFSRHTTNGALFDPRCPDIAGFRGWAPVLIDGEVLGRPRSQLPRIGRQLNIPGYFWN
jgi:hypothetical protein